MSGFRGKVAAITGAGSGIGRALALELAARGARLALADWDEDGLRESESLLEARGAEVVASRVDVSDRVSVAEFATQTAQRFGSVHQIYNNAGISGNGRTILDNDYAAIERVLAVNLWGVIHGTREFLPHLIASRDGHVINTSSAYGIAASPHDGPYSASKFAVRGFTEALRCEMLLAHHPVAVTVVHPAGVRTKIARSAWRTEDVTQFSEEEKRRADVYEQKLLTADPSDVARQILAGVEKRRGRVLVAGAQGIDRLVRLLPEQYPKFVVQFNRRTFGGS